MILVVFAHIESISYGMSSVTDGFLRCLFSSFRMPLFFFISGYVAYKPSSKWTYTLFFQNIKKRIIAQIIPTFVFLSLFLLWKDRSFSTIITKGPQEYWFTPVLFEIYLVYLCISCLTKLLKPYFYDYLVLMVSFFSILLFSLSLKYLNLDICPLFSLQNVCRFSVFFLFGTVVKKYSSGVHEVLSKDCFITSSMVLFFVLFLSFYNSWFIKFPLLHVINYEIILKFVGLIFVYSIVYYYREIFEQTTVWCNFLRSIGRHTLDIYMIHYFLLPRLPFMRVYFDGDQNVLIELVFTLLMAILVVIVSMFISRIIRSSHFLGRFLLAAK